MSNNNLTKNTFSCDVCNKYYTNHSGMWKHKQKHHKTVPVQNQPLHVPNIGIEQKQKDNLIKNCLICKKCNWVFNSNSTRWRHEKNCLGKDTNEDVTKLKNEIKEIKSQLTKLAYKPNIINNNYGKQSNKNK